MVVDRLHCTSVYLYKRIVTNKVVAMTIIVLWIMTVVTAINQPSLYQLPVGNCLLATTQIQAFPITLWITALVVIVTIYSIYFCYKIYKSNKFFNIVHTTTEKRQGNHCRKLLEKLQKRVKFYCICFDKIVGGIDGLFNLLMPLIWLGEQFVFTQNPLVRQVAIYTNAIILGTSTAVVEPTESTTRMQ